VRGLMLAIGAVGGVLIALAAAMVRRGGLSEMGAPLWAGSGQESGTAGLNRVRTEVETIKREVESMEQSIGAMHWELLSRMDDIRAQLGTTGMQGRGTTTTPRGARAATSTGTRQAAAGTAAGSRQPEVKTTGRSKQGESRGTTAGRASGRGASKSEAAVAAETFTGTAPRPRRARTKTQVTPGQAPTGTPPAGEGQTQNQPGQ
jgi:hypothetical protein